MKRISLATLALLLVALLSAPGFSLATEGPPGMVLEERQAGPEVLASSAEVGFPLRLGFKLSARSEVPVTDIRLQYVVDRAGFARVTSEVSIEFEPTAAPKVEWTFDLRKIGGLPPGANIEYWWKLTDASGARLTSPPETVKFDDGRFSWRSITEGMITLYWYQGDEAFSRELMRAAQQSLARLAADTGAEPEKQIRMYIYADARALQGAMIFPQEWTGGVAFSRHSTIAIGIGPGDLGWGRRAIAHELAHLVVHQMTFNPYSDLPTWLDEGLAMHAEGEMEPPFAALLDKAIKEDKLITVRSLSSPFSAYAEESALAYAQSQSIVEFLITGYGQDRMFQLLNIFRRGSSYDGAPLHVYGFDMDGLNQLWRDHVKARVPVGAGGRA